MLYELWDSLATANGSAEAVVNTATGQVWTFRELWAVADEIDHPGMPLVLGNGAGVDFLIQVLQAWKFELPLCCGPAVKPRPAWLTEHETALLRPADDATWIAFTEPQILSEVDQIVETMGLRADWPNVGVISLTHSYGFGNLVLPLLLHGIPLRLASPAGLAQALHGQSAVTLPAVPALWEAWLAEGLVSAIIRRAISTGPPLSLALEHALHAAGVKGHHFSGNPACGGITYDRTEAPRSTSQLIGTALEGVTLTQDAAGLLVVTSPAVGMVYGAQPLDGQMGTRTTELRVTMRPKGEILLA